MTFRKPALLVAAAATVALGGVAASDIDQPSTSSAGDFLCTHAEDAAGNRVGPEVCVPWFLPVP